jgi:cold shock CspA family protein
LEKIGLRRLNDGQRVGYELYDDRGRIAAGNIKLL